MAYDLTKMHTFTIKMYSFENEKFLHEIRWSSELCFKLKAWIIKVKASLNIRWSIQIVM